MFCGEHVLGGCPRHTFLNDMGKALRLLSGLEIDRGVD